MSEALQQYAGLHVESEQRGSSVSPGSVHNEVARHILPVLPIINLQIYDILLDRSP